MAEKITNEMRRYWRDKKRAWRKANPKKDKEYENKKSGHNTKVSSKTGK